MNRACNEITGFSELLQRFERKDLDAMNIVSHYYDIGLNILLKGHNAKITLQYASRPLHNATDMRLMKRAGEWQACFQLFF